MNKVMCLCAAAALAFASCSNDETVEIAKQNAISFRSVVGLNTKGAETTTDNLQAIYVTAVKAQGSGPASYFNKVKFEKSGNFFESVGNKYYWPTDDSELNFFATSDNWSGDMTVKSGFYVDNVTIDDDIANQQDMVYAAEVKGKKSANEANGLPLELKHALSQIQINAKNSNSLYNYKVKGIRIAKVKNGGDLAASSNAWTVKGDEKTYEVTYDTPVALLANGQTIMGTDAGNAMLIPQTVEKWDGKKIDDDVDGSYISVLVNITTNAGAAVYPAGSTTADPSYGWASVPVKFEWEMGKKYIYTLDFTNGAGKVDPVDPGTDVKPGTDDPDKGKDILGEPIKFTVTVTGWTEASSDVEMSK